MSSNKLQLPVSFVWSRADMGYVITDANDGFVGVIKSKNDAKMICSCLNAFTTSK